MYMWGGVGGSWGFPGFRIPRDWGYRMNVHIRGIDWYLSVEVEWTNFSYPRDSQEMRVRWGRGRLSSARDSQGFWR